VLRDWWAPSGVAPASTGIDPSGVERAVWRPDDLARLAGRLGDRGRAALASVPAERRLEVWSEAVEALLDPESDERRALLPRLVDSSRLSPEGLSEALEIVLGGVAGEPASRLAARALDVDPPPGPAGVVVAANVPALAAQSILPALLLGRPLLVRSSAREPLFAPALLAALGRREPALGEAFVAATWPSDDATATQAALGPLDRVLAYGGDPALDALRDRLGERLVAFGPRASVALVAPPVDELSVARALARDVARLDQRGCLSVHAIWVAGPAREFAEALAFALAGEARRLPPGPIEEAVASVAQQLRGTAALGDALIGGLELREGTVLLAADARFRPSPGARLVRVHEAPDLDAALAALAPERGRLQGAALAGGEALGRSAEIEERLGLARVAPAGDLQHVEAGAATGGLDPFPYLAGASAPEPE